MTHPKKHRYKAVALLVGVWLTTAIPAMAQKTKIAVMPFSPQGVEERVSTILDSLLVIEVDHLGRYEVLGSSDIKAMLGLEGLKQSLGCDDVSCAAEIGGALGVELLFTGVLGRLGSNLMITANVIDVKKTKVLSRASLKIPNNEDLFDQGIRDIVKKLFAEVPIASQATAAAPPASSSGMPAAPVVAPAATPAPTSAPSQAPATTAPPVATSAPAATSTATPATAPASAKRKGISNAWWATTTALAVASFAAATAFGVLKIKRENQALDGQFIGDLGPQELMSKARTNARLTNAFLGVGGALALMTIPLAIVARPLRDKTSPRGTTAGPQASLSIMPSITLDGAFISATVRQ